MTYEKHTWQNGEVITADKLNNIEDGIEDTGDNGFLVTYTMTWDETIGENVWSCDKTVNEIKDAFDSGVNVYATTKKYGDSTGAYYFLHTVYDGEIDWIQPTIADGESSDWIMIAYYKIVHTDFDNEEIITETNNSSIIPSSWLSQYQEYYPKILHYDHNTSKLTGANFESIRNAFYSGQLICFIDNAEEENGKPGILRYEAKCLYVDGTGSFNKRILFSAIDKTGGTITKVFKSNAVGDFEEITT